MEVMSDKSIPQLGLPQIYNKLATMLTQSLQAKAMEVMSDKSIPEFGPFGFTLALRVAQLLKSELHGGSAWGVSVCALALRVAQLLKGE